jgi:ribose transport system permease protein
VSSSVDMNSAPPVESRVPRILGTIRSHAQPSEIVRRFGLVFAWAVVIVVFSILRPSVFPTVANFSTIFGTQAVILVLTLGLLIPMTTGDYDLSIAAVLTLSAMIVALLNVTDHWAILPAMLVAVTAGVVVGFINGAIVVLVGIDPFIVTLGTGTVLQGVVLWMSNSQTISGVSNTLVSNVVLKRFLSIPLEFWYGIGLMIILWYVFQYTPLGRRLLFVGRGRNVARLSGIRVGRTRWGALVASGFIAAIAGVLYAGSTGAADPTSGLAFLLPAFAAAFLGSTAIYPGRFNPIGATIAVFFLITGITGLQLVGAQSYAQQLFYGGALVIAVGLTQVAARRKNASGVGSAET